MNTRGAGNDAALDVGTAARADKIALLYARSLPAVFIAPAMAVVLSWGLWAASNRDVLLLWLGLLAVCLVARVLVFVAYSWAAPRGAAILRWERPYAVSLFVTTLVWGLGGAAVVPEDDSARQMFTFFVMLGVAGGAAVAYAAFRYMAVWSTFAVLLPSLVRLASVAESPVEGALVLAAATFLLAATLASRTFSEALGRSFELAHQLGALNRQLDEREQHFRFIAEKSGDAIWAITPAADAIVYVSPAVRDLLGFEPEELVERPLEAVMLRDSMRRLRRRLQATRQARERSFKLMLDFVHRDGNVVHVAAVGTVAAPVDGRSESIVIVTHDISEIQRHTDVVRRMAYIDPLTELPNRRLLIDRLGQAIAHARRDGTRVGVLCIDLDGFKPINDRYGHQAGDHVLREVGARLTACVREADTAARVGGDEFVVLLTDLTTREDCAATAQKIVAAIGAPYTSPEGLVLTAGASVGIAVFPDDATDQWQLLGIGDSAMYRAKRSRGDPPRMSA